jgi:xylulokinase
VVGCLDQYAGAIGAGNVEPGTISETTGTVLATVRCTDRFLVESAPTVFQGPAFREGLYWQMAFGQVSANYLHWYRGQLPDRLDFDRLTALAAQIELGADGLRLRTDVGLTNPEEVFEGLTVRHTHGHKVRCILETVACALGDQVAALTDGSLPGPIRCAGGAARSNVWLQIKADVLGVATAPTVCSEPTSLGAAMLAKASLEGIEVGTIARQWVHLQEPRCPDPKRHRQYHLLRSRLSASN